MKFSKHSDHQNILHVVNIYFSIPNCIGGQLKYFGEKGYKMHVVSSASPYLEGYAAEQGFDYREIPVLRAINPVQDIKSIWKICRYIKDRNIGIIVGHTPKGGLLSMIAGWIMHVPKRIYFRHGLVYETSSGLMRFILMNADRLTSLLSTQIVCVSPSVLAQSIHDHLAPAYKQLILHKGTCRGIDTEGIFNPTNLDHEKLDAMKELWGIKNDDWVIGYSGRLVKDKGIVELVKAFCKLKKEDSRYKLLLVGMFEERDALPDEIQEEIKTTSQIIWTDFQNSDIQYFYAMMNVYVFPSYREGFGHGSIEAQAMEIPVITTRATGCRDSIVEGETGVFVDHDAEELASTIRSVHDGKIILSGSKAREWVKDNFENHIVWNEIEKLY